MRGHNLFRWRNMENYPLTLLHSERPKLYTVVLSECNRSNYPCYLYLEHCCSSSLYLAYCVLSLELPQLPMMGHIFLYQKLIETISEVSSKPSFCGPLLGLWCISTSKFCCVQIIESFKISFVCHSL